MTGSIQMKLFSLFSSANRSANRRNQLAVKNKRPNLFAQSDFFDDLEKRQLLTATFSASGTQFIIDLNSAGDQQISSTGTSYLFTLANGTSNTWTGTGTASVSNATSPPMPLHSTPTTPSPSAVRPMGHASSF